MPRYLVQGRIPNRSGMPFGRDCYQDLTDSIQRSTAKGANWVLSFVSRDEAYCIYDAPSSEMMRDVAINSRHPVDRITEVKILDPAIHD
jgi:hypothetical protein